MAGETRRCSDVGFPGGGDVRGVVPRGRAILLPAMLGWMFNGLGPKRFGYLHFWAVCFELFLSLEARSQASENMFRDLEPLSEAVDKTQATTTSSTKEIQSSRLRYIEIWRIADLESTFFKHKTIEWSINARKAKANELFKTRSIKNIIFSYVRLKD
ncbi:hypothetical protein YC2023_054962 [Brassica napus]